MRRSILYVMKALALSVVFLSAGTAFAQQAIHDQVRPSLVQLFAEGAPTIGDHVGEPDGVKSSGTGFFIGKDGYILTTAHFFAPLKKQRAVNTKIMADIVTGIAPNTTRSTVDVKYVSSPLALDLVLLKANIRYGTTQPASLEIGSSVDVDQDSPGLMTSGYDGGVTYVKKNLDLNEPKSETVSFAWSMNGKTNSGQSGSPVYIAKDGKPLVVGVIKATAREDDELTFMIPIEFSLPLIGHFKFQEMSDKMQEMTIQISGLYSLIGKIEPKNPPYESVHNRVLEIEKLAKQIKENFTFSAETRESDGSVVIKIKKLVPGGPEIGEVKVKITPTLYTKATPPDFLRGAQLSITWGALSAEPQTALQKSLTSEYLVSDVQKRLTEDLLKADEEIFLRNQEPYRYLKLQVIAQIGETTHSDFITIVPRYRWKYR